MKEVNVNEDYKAKYRNSDLRQQDRNAKIH